MTTKCNAEGRTSPSSRSCSHHYKAQIFMVIQASYGATSSTFKSVYHPVLVDNVCVRARSLKPGQQVKRHATPVDIFSIHICSISILTSFVRLTCQAHHIATGICFSLHILR